VHKELKKKPGRISFRLKGGKAQFMASVGKKKLPIISKEGGKNPSRSCARSVRARAGHALQGGGSVMRKWL